MFTGIDDVDWASMEHAYGDASDVPRLLRGLASPDPAERDAALDGMYGAVHHQGDVYACTVACIPFLFDLLLLPTVQDRGAILELLCSIAGEEEPDPDEIWSDFEDEEEHRAWVANYVDASAMIRGRPAYLFALLDDPDPQLRAKVPGALVQLHADAGRVLEAMRLRLPAEPSVDAVRALVAAIGDLGVRHGGEPAREAADCLLRVVYDAQPHPELLLTALTGLARCAPDLMPPDTAALAGEAMRAVREEGAPTSTPSRPRTDTFVSYLRQLQDEHRAAADADAATEQLQQLHTALADRTDERLALLVDQLCSPSPGQSLAAIRQSGLLLSGWRLPSEEPVRLLARQVLHEDERSARAALGELAFVHPLARGVADVVAESLPDFRHEADDQEWWWTRFGRAVEMLALQGDPRAVPELAWALRAGSLPSDLRTCLDAVEPHTAPLGPVLLERLVHLHPEAHRRRARLLDALAVPAPADALPLAASFLDSEDIATRLAAQAAVARYGARAAEHAARIRESATSDSSPYRRVKAAEALWSVTGEDDLELVLGTVDAVLRLERPNDRTVGFEAARRLGRAAASLAPLLRERMAETDHRWEAAVALWHVTGEAGEVAPVLVEEWTRTPYQLPRIAACLAELGPAATDAVPLAQAQLARARRHGNDDPSGQLRCHVDEDEELRRNCLRIVEGASRR
ncbi:HEAT repeat domain-containing protein [Streptomyces sp. NPDC051907]|uniref:HEAT repeat domain-containing protein n=1 Tax=Streptomyces sp. NPDC051907 TaxID=3155284 RepID=UPI00343E5069